MWAVYGMNVYWGGGTSCLVDVEVEWQCRERGVKVGGGGGGTSCLVDVEVEWQCRERGVKVGGGGGIKVGMNTDFFCWMLIVVSFGWHIIWGEFAQFHLGSLPHFNPPPYTTCW